MSENSKKKRMVALRARVYLELTEPSEKGPITKPVQAGETFHVPEDEVQQWTKPITGHYGFRGERFDGDPTLDRPKLTRAEVISGAPAA